MGIEISENDRHYVNFLNTFLPPEEQINYNEHKKIAQTPPSEKIEHAARESRPIPHPERSHSPHPKSSDVTAQKIHHETEDQEIDSLISSLFSKREKKGE